MQKGERASTAFTYLFNSDAQLAPLVRISERAVRVRLTTPISDAHTDFDIPFNEKDQKTLIVFDGDIPWQGLPRAAHEVLQTWYGVSIPLAHVRKHRQYEEQMPETLADRNGIRALVLRRHFVLMPATTALVRRYRPENLSARYSLVEVAYDGTYSCVSWRSSSY